MRIPRDSGVPRRADRPGWVALFVLALAACGALVAANSVAAAPAPPAGAATLALVDIDAIGPARLAALRGEPGLAWWVEVEDRLLVSATPEALAAIGRERAVELLPGVAPERLYFVRRAHRGLLAEVGLAPLVTGGRWAVVEGPASGAELPALDDPGDGGAHGLPSPQAEPLAAEAPFPLGVHASWVRFEPNVVLARQAANDPRLAALSSTTPEGSDPIAPLVAEVDAPRWFADVTTLASWNRYTRGTEIALARDWLIGELETLPGLTVTTQSFSVTGTPAFNVIATLPGTVRPDDWYVVGAHYDSTSQSPSVAAPGAEDNASGCAGVLELARIFSRHRPQGTMMFLCYSGEEQGLYGGTAHASKLVTDGDASKVQAVLTMDMIGYTGDSDLDCLLESNSSNAALLQEFATAAASYTGLRIVTSFFPFGSDHVPYLNRGMPALLVIENDWDSYPAYHRTTDLPANVDLAMGGETLRMNVATMALLAGAAGASEIFSDGFESGDTSAWLLQQP